jgi:prepilin-type processing-associated H-X9-DG protein
MKLDNSEKQRSGLTLTEVLVITVVVAVLAALLLPALWHDGCGHKIRCVNNLKQIGLAARIFAEDNSERFPMEVPVKDGGSKEFVQFGLVVPHFLVVSNELSTPKLLVCPRDKRHEAANFNELRGENISYFVGLEASQTNPQSMLAGDRNVTNGSPGNDRLCFLTTNQPVGWTREIHQHSGNVVFGDGSVQQVDSAGLQQLLRNSGVATNRLAIP